MGRALQAIGLLFMFVGLLGSALFSLGNPGLIALADPCVPDLGGVTSSSPSPLAAPTGSTASASPAATIAPAASSTPQTVIPPRLRHPQPQAGPSFIAAGAPIATVPPSSPTPVPTGTPSAAKQLPSYPVFNSTEELTAPKSTSSPQAQVTTPAPEVNPTPAVPPCPVHRHRLFGEGPIELSGTGTMNMGAHHVQNGDTATSQNQVGASMNFTVSRRTDQSSLVVSQAVGDFNGLYNAAQINVGYSTPKYLVDYGPVNGASDTQLSSGSFNQGVTLGIPHGAEEWDLIGARTQGVNGEGYRVGAIRHSRTSRTGSLLSETLYDAIGDQSHGNAATLDLAFTRFSSSKTLRLETAASSARNIPTVADGLRLAYGANMSFNGSSSSTNLSYTHIPDAYVALGQVQFEQSQFQFTHRNPFLHSGVLTFDYGDLYSGSGGQNTHSTHATFNLNQTLFKDVNSQWLLNFSSTGSQGDYARERDAALTLSEQVRGFSLQESAQSSVVNDQLAGQASQTQLMMELSHGLFGGYATLTGNVLKSQGGGASGRVTDALAQYTRTLGSKAEFSLSAEAIQNSLLGSSSTNQFTTTYSLLRRISPVVGVRATYGKTHQSGLYGGSASYLNFDVVGPLALGTAARYTGRANPNLPAVIQGHVYLQTEATSYGLTGNRGFPNVLVTLDGGITQRTDATGSYEFRFVKPGPHIISISAGTLPAGVIADSSSQSLIVQGGQVAVADFSAGAFAGVGGAVMEQVNGALQPVPNVLLVVDGSQRGYSGVDGSYQIGHLTNGKHKISISADTLPATLAVAGDDTKEIDVNQGSVTPLNWLLTGLGSIQGVVLYTADAGFGDLVGALNVYVVADPGQHAAITDSEGHFIIDNLPPGAYTLSIDQDTLPDGQTILQGPEGPVNVVGGEPTAGVTFKIGPQAKQVVLTFGGGQNAAVNATFEPDKAPPNSIVDLVVTTNEAHPRSVTAQSDVFGSVPLRYAAARHAWVARLFVGPSVQNGDHAVHVDVQGAKTGGTDASLTVSNALPLIYARGTPSNPRPGESVHVLAKIVAQVEAGDQVVFEDGQSLSLPEPHGHIYAFTVHPKHALPYHGLVFTKKGERLPFVIGQ